MNRNDLRYLIGPRYKLGPEAIRGYSAQRVFGYDNETGEDVFIKARSFTPEDPEVDVRTRTRNEAEALKSINHSQIPRHVDSDPEAEYPYIIMQRMEGSVNPIRALERHPDYQRAARLIIEALSALQSIHGAGFSHNDVKENNLVVPRAGPAALIDLELVRPLSEASTAGPAAKAAFDPREVRGTRPFMAPEQFLGHSYDGVRSDIYAMGITLSVMTNGKRPYQGNSPEDTLKHKIASPQVVPWPVTDREVPQDLQLIIEKATRADPSERYNDTTAMSLALEESLC